jgi:hypothetical protein
MAFDFAQGGDEMDRIAEETQIDDDDFARRAGLFIKICRGGVHEAL